MLAMHNPALHQMNEIGLAFSKKDRIKEKTHILCAEVCKEDQSQRSV